MAPVKITVSTRSCFYPTILSPPPPRRSLLQSLLQFPPGLQHPAVCRPPVVSFSFAFDHVLRLYSFLRANSPSNRLLLHRLSRQTIRCHSTIKLVKWGEGTRVEDILFRYQKILDFCAKKKKITRDRKNNTNYFFEIISSKFWNTCYIFKSI